MKLNMVKTALFIVVWNDNGLHTKAKNDHGSVSIKQTMTLLAFIDRSNCNI